MGSSEPQRRTLRHRLSGLRPEEKLPDQTAHLLASGATAGLVSKLVTAPIDRVKLMYQVNADRPFSMGAGARTAARIVRESGPSGLWAGNGAAVVRDVPYAAVMFSSYAVIEEALCSYVGREPDVLTRATAGCFAGAFATMLTYPLDVLRARFGGEWAATPRYTSYAQGVREIVRREGYVALFAGLQPTLLGIMPYSALSFAAFETTKAFLRRRAAAQRDEEQQQRRLSEAMRAEQRPGQPRPLASPARRPHDPDGIELPVGQRLAAGGFAGLTAQAATYPLHVVRRRMQTGAFAPRSLSTWQALSAIYTAEGVAGGLYKGLTLTFMKGPLQSAIGFTVNDWCKRQLRERERGKER